MGYGFSYAISSFTVLALDHSVIVCVSACVRVCVVIEDFILFWYAKKLWGNQQNLQFLT
jgi:hypothetical protein